MFLWSVDLESNFFINLSENSECLLGLDKKKNKNLYSIVFADKVTSTPRFN